MRKRLDNFTYVFILFFLLVALISFIAKFLFPSHSDIFMTFGFFSIGIAGLYGGIKQIQKAKTQEEFIIWWKSWVIVSALSFVSWGALFLTFELPNQINGVLKGILVIFLILLIGGLSFYALILLLQQMETDKRRRQELGVQQMRQSRPMPKDEQE